MHTLPGELLHVIVRFAPVFPKRLWNHATVLLLGVILTSDKCTMTAPSWVMGWQEAQYFQYYHRPGDYCGCLSAASAVRSPHRISRRSSSSVRVIRSRASVGCC
jgi:hypothetical protein